MYDKRAERRAVEYGILDKVQALENELLKIEGVINIKFDLDNYDELPQVILIPRYDAGPLDGGYFARRKAMLENILTVCERHGLCDSGDHIEDYGEHWYIVRDCGKTWMKGLYDDYRKTN